MRIKSFRDHEYSILNYIDMLRDLGFILGISQMAIEVSREEFDILAKGPHADSISSVVITDEDLPEDDEIYYKTGDLQVLFKLK